MAERFYLNWPLAAGRVELSGGEAHHLATVCRLRAGDAVCLFNGDGREYHGRVVAVQRRQVAVEIDAVHAPDRELPFAFEVAAPLPKGDRSHFLVEKLTELGVSRFVPLETARSVVQARDTKLEKLARYVSEASKQCGRNVLMEIDAPASWANYCGRHDAAAVRIVAHPRVKTARPTHELAEVLHEAKSAAGIVVAVGPEGGFTEEEIVAAAGWIVADLGPRILRIETAALLLASWAVAGRARA